MKKVALCLFIACALVLISLGNARAATLNVWDGSSSTTWTTPANWSEEVITNSISVSGHIARFNANPSYGRMPKIYDMRSIHGLRFDFNPNYAQWRIDNGSNGYLKLGSACVNTYDGMQATINVPIDPVVGGGFYNAGGVVTYAAGMTSSNATPQEVILSGTGTSVAGADFNPAATLILQREGGLLQLGADNLQVAVTGNGIEGLFVMRKGTLDLNGYSATVGELDVDGTLAALDYNGVGNAVSFMDSSSQDWGSFTLDILGYDIAAPMSLRFGTDASGLSAAQLGLLVFKGIGDGGADIVGGQIDASGYVTPIPEPVTLVLLGLGALGLRRRHN